MTTFTRGLDPKRAMGTGVITWDNLTAGCTLRTTRPVEMAEEKKSGHYKFCTDRSKKGRTMDDRDLHLYKYTCVNNMIEIEYNYINVVPSSSQSTRFNSTGFLRGSLKQFKNHFEILQKG